MHSSVLRACALFFATLLLVSGAHAFDGEITRVRISDRGNGDAYNVSVATKGAGMKQVARIALEFPRSADPKPQERSHSAELFSKKAFGEVAAPFSASTKGQVYSITATLRSAKGAALGTPQEFEGVIGELAVEVDPPAQRDQNGRVQRIRLLEGAGGTVRHVVVGEGAMIDRVASIELQYNGGAGAPDGPLRVDFDRVDQHYRAVVVFDEPAVGAKLPLELTLQDAEGNRLGEKSTMEVEVEAARARQG